MGIRCSICCFAILANAGILAAGSLSNADKQFLAMAARTNMTEANEGQMAQNQASSQQVKDFAQTLVQDHTKAFGDVARLASQSGTTIPTGINTGKIATVQQLKHLKGASFDRQFARDEVTDHQQALAAYKREAAHGSDPAVKDYASKQIPVLEKHLQMAQDAAKATKRS